VTGLKAQPAGQRSLRPIGKLIRPASVTATPCSSSQARGSERSTAGAELGTGDAAMSPGIADCAVHSWSRTFISANPSRLVPRQRDGRLASGWLAAIPMPQIRSRGRMAAAFLRGWRQGPRLYDWALIATASPAHHLLVRRSMTPKGNGDRLWTTFPDVPAA
jgi:hypothetical protein